jgi:hypothetical protein
LQDEIEKVSAFGKVADQQIARKKPPAEQSEAGEQAGEEEPVEAQPACISVPTVTRTGKSCEEIEGL